MNTDLQILDGGMGRLLEKMGAPFRRPEWSALALMEKPEEVAKAHNLFIEAGCDIITANTYALVPFHIGEERWEKDGRSLISLAANIARDCADQSDKTIKMAGSIPPVFGSYRPDLFDENTALKYLKPLIEEQKDYVDFWLAETISSAQEARVIAKALENSDKDLWLSYTLKDREKENIPSQLRSGDSLADAIDTAHEINAKALLFNCSQVIEMSSALKQAKELTDLPLGVYANAFGPIKPKHDASTINTPVRDITPEEYLDAAKEWKDIGAGIIGGCCGIMPEHIKTLESLR